jgi:(5-formylfuran-3-yl)methyl phosphate synthase
MTQLLVSVRDADEAKVALDAGADVIDVKEPLRGSLGAADSATIAEIVRIVRGSVPVSVALSELIESPSAPELLQSNPTFAKVGLAGCLSRADWRCRWESLLSGFPDTTSPVAVVYADESAAKSPMASEIIEHATRMQCAAVLVDTWDKTAGPLTAHWSFDRICSFVLDVQSRGMKAVIAGGLTFSSLPQIALAKPDLVAVRGAACRGERTGVIAREKILQLKQLLASSSHNFRIAQSHVSFA